METRMMLVALCEQNGLTQERLAEDFQVSRAAVGKWCRGEARPHPDTAYALAKRFGVRDPADLFRPEPKPLQDDLIMDYLLKLDRRELLAKLQVLPVFAGVNVSALLDTPNTTHEDFLEQCSAGINACWHLLKHDGLTHAENILNACIPKLSDLATQPSDLQEMAASLATEAKIQQTICAAHRLDYRARGIYALGAVHFGKLSGNMRIHAVAISWQADMYTSSWNRQPQPEKAIKLFRDGLAGLDDGAFLNKTDLSIGLAKAYALNGNEDEAIEMITQARKAMPEDPEQDPLYQIIEIGQSELDQQEGRIYLELDRLFPNQGYAQMAYDTFNRGADKQITSDRVQSNLLIHKAEAARALGALDDFIKCLRMGILIAFQIDSKKRQGEAKKILGKAPDSWKREQEYQDLVKMF